MYNIKFLRVYLSQLIFKIDEERIWKIVFSHTRTRFSIIFLITIQQNFQQKPNCEEISAPVIT